MKKLIEKGIGVILLCLQIIMAATTAYAICRFAYEYVIVVGDGYSHWGIFNGHRSMYFLPEMSMREKMIHYTGDLFSAIGGIIVGGLLGILLLALIKMVFLTEYEAHETRKRFKDKGGKWYGYPKGKAVEIIKEDWDRVCKSFDLSRLSFYMCDSTNGKDMSYRFSGIGGLVNMLMSCGLALSIIRKSKDDIEQDRDSANSDMAIYRSNEKEAESKYLSARIKSEDKMISDRGFTCLSVFARECLNYIRIPSVNTSCWVSDTFFFFVNHWFILIVTLIFFLFPSIGEWMYDTFLYGEEGVGDSLFDFFTWTTSVLLFICFRILYWWNVKKDKIRLQIRQFDTNDCFDEPFPPNYKKSSIDFVDFAIPRYGVVSGAALYPSYHILDIFQAFLDLHKEGWRMKIFPFSAERVRQEKADAAARGEEIVIFPDVDEIEARLAEEERKEQRIASIGEL